jgi:uncharacterized membrane protein YqjE
MTPATIQTIINITFAVVIGLMALVSLMTMYVFIRYGRSRSFALLTSLVFAGIFILGAVGAFFTLQQIL